MPATKQIRVLLEQIDSMKSAILMVEFDKELPFVTKTEKLESMRRALFLTEHYALQLMEEKIKRTKAS